MESLKVPRKWRGRFQNQVLIGTLLVSPLLIFLILTFFVPLGYTLISSLQGNNGNITLVNYHNLLNSTSFGKLIGLTLFLSLTSTFIAIVLSLVLALLLRRSFHGKKILMYLMVLPIVIPALVGSLGLLLLYDRTGWLNIILLNLHVIEKPLRIDYTIPGLILFYVWMFFPYGGLVLVGGAQAIDYSLEEAGQVLGATPFRVFREILFPLLIPSLLASIILIFLQTFGAFSVPLIAGGDYQPLAVKIFTVATVFLQWHEAAAMAIIMAIVQIILLLLNNRLTKGRGEQL